MRDENTSPHLEQLLAKLQDRTAVIGAVYGPSTEMLGYLAQAMLLGLGGWLVSEGRLSIGELAAFCGAG